MKNSDREIETLVARRQIFRLGWNLCICAQLDHILGLFGLVVAFAPVALLLLVSYRQDTVRQMGIGIYADIVGGSHRYAVAYMPPSACICTRIRVIA